MLQLNNLICIEKINIYVQAIKFQNINCKKKTIIDNNKCNDVSGNLWRLWH